MVTKTLIVLLTVFCLLPVYGEDNPKGDIIVNGIPYNVCSFNDESLIKYIETYMETQSIKQI